MNYKNKSAYFLFVTASSIFLSGCATNGVADYRSSGINEHVVKEPTASNGFQGVLVEMPPSAEGALDNRATEICSTRGGLKSRPTYYQTAPIGWKFYRYACNGFPAEIPKPAPAQQSQQNQQRQIENQNTSQLLDLDEAKSKCSDLGFKPNTEGFGKCVLRLTK